MGRKANNLPARLARKKKIKDKNNLQIQGRAGLGRRREKGRSERQKQRQKPREKPVDPPVAQLSYVELAKQQEQKAEAATTQPSQVVQAPQSKKARRKQRKRTQQEAERSETWEKSHVIPKADLKRDDTLYFGEDRAQEGNDGEEKGPLPKASAIELSPGMLVRIAGLKNMTTLNGETCTLQSWNVAAERWSVRIEGNDKLLKKENLEVKALLRPHTPVRLIGLRMQELNGKNGLCREWKAEKSRWLVAVEGHGDVLRKAENLEVLLKPGLQVQLCGLQTSELNGAEAVCLAPLQGRWRVRLEGGAEKALRPENLAVLSQEATFCPAVTQHVEVLEAEEKPSRLLCILRDVQEAERKGLVQRSLTLVFCLEASIAPVSLALGQRQVACLKLTASNQQERLKGFHLDGKRVLLCTDEALSAYGASSIPEVARAVSYDLPDLQCHRKRLERLNKSGEEPGGCYHAFVTDQVPAEVCRGLCEMLQAARIPIHPRLKELSTREDHGQRWSRRAQSNTNSFTSSSSRHDGCSKDVQRTVRSKDLVRSLGGQCPSRFAPFLSLPMRILVIGAGASGLVTAKTAREAGHEVSIVEAGSAIGGTFVNKTYKDARMVSSKYLTCFSDFRRPEAEMHMTMKDYVLYLQEYSAHFGLLELIRFNVKVINVQKGCNTMDSYDVTLQADGDDSHPYVEVWDAVAICSGLHSVPRIPEFPGQQKFEGQILHSANYKDPEIFKGRKVLIIGTGETAFDLGYAAATNGAQSVTMSTRHGFVSVPACFGENNPPLDCVIMNWATHAWESKWAQRVGMHWWVTTKFTRLGFLFTTGCSYGFNQWVGKRYNMTWDDGRKHIVNKSSKCMPLLSRAAKKKVSWLRRIIYSWMDGEYNDIPLDIDLVEGSVLELQPDGVVYDTATGEQHVNTDLLVLATGYRQRFPFLHGEGTREDPLPQRHFLVDPQQPRLSYIGFIRPNVGAIPPMAEMQAMWWCRLLEDKVKEGHPLDSSCYRLTDSRLCYGVDYGYYMFALAKEMGAAPSLRHWLWRDWRVMLTCAFGQAHVPIFRLQGPFRSAACQATCRSELYNVLWTRPVVMNLTFLIEAITFGVINGVATLLESGGRCLMGMGLGMLAFAGRNSWPKRLD